MSKMAKNSSTSSSVLPFGKKNYLFFGIGVVSILLGYLLMGTENFIDATEFSLALYVCPFLIVGGLCVVGYSILVRPGQPNPAADSGASDSSENTSQQ